jgi:hypothetical protein
MNRQWIINAIIEAAREPVPEIRPIIQIEHAGERQQIAGGIPFGTTTTTNQQVVGYAFANPQGYLYGRIEQSCDDLAKRHNQEEAEEMDKLRTQLEQLNDAELQLQADLWLNHGASQHSTLRRSEYTKQDRERDARLWRIMGARGSETRADICFQKMSPVGAEATLTRQERWRPGPSDRLEGGFAPRFHDSHEAKHSLFLWLSQDPDDWGAFITALTTVLSQGNPAPHLPDYFCATPRDVAIAADEALRASGRYRNNNTIRLVVRTATAAA